MSEPVVTAFEDWVKKTPNAIATIVNADGSYEVSSTANHLVSADLNARCNRVANTLLKSGSSAPVGILIERTSLWLIPSMLGAMKAGITYVPLDPILPRERMKTMLEMADVRVVLTSKTLEKLLPMEWTASDRRIALDDPEAALSADVTNPTGQKTDPCSIQYILFTSGSTGKPKGVEVLYGGIANCVESSAQRMDFTSKDRFICTCTICFDVSVLEIFMPLYRGGGVVLADGVHGVAGWVERPENRVSFGGGTPSAWTMLRELPWGNGGMAANMPGMTIILIGEAIPKDLATFLLAAGGRLFNGYGPTETTIISTLGEVTNPNNITAGTAIARTSLYVVDPASGQVVTGSTPGELYIGGAGVARSYLNLPEVTVKKFTQFEGERVFTTGDSVHWTDDGEIVTLGRLDSQVKVNGYRIELEEIEGAIRAVPGVAQAAVRVRTDQDGTKLLAAFLQLQPEDVVGEEEGGVDAVRDIWDGAYIQGTDKEECFDPTLNYSGYVDSFSPDGSLHARASIQETTEETVKRILAWTKHRNLMEMGMGMGMILFRVAEACDRMYGAEMSQAACDYVENVLKKHPPCAPVKDKVTLHCCSADAIANEFKGANLDTVVINGTVAYFPTRAYTCDVLQQVASVLNPGGHFFLGDVRSLLHLPHWCAMRCAFGEGFTGTGAEMSAKIEDMVKHEEEQLLPPSFFLSRLGEEWERVDCHLRRGSLHNEFTMFRYDAMFQRKQAFSPPERREPFPAPPLEVHQWESGGSGMLVDDYLDRLYDAHKGAPFVCANIPNARVALPCTLLQLLKDKKWAQAPVERCIEAARELAKSDLEGWVEVEVLYQWGEKRGLSTQVCFSPVRAQCMDVLFAPAGDLHKSTSLVELLHAKVDMDDFAEPLVPKVASPDLQQRVVASLKATLPLYMLPRELLVVRQMPYTTSQKIDGNALLRAPVPVGAAVDPLEAIGDNASREEISGLVSSMVRRLSGASLADGEASLPGSTVLGSLGWNSLMAIRARNQLQNQLSLQLPITLLFAHNTLDSVVDEVHGQSQQRASKNTDEEMLEAKAVHLSVQQQAVVLLSQLATDNSALYNTHLLVEMQDAPDINRMNVALKSLVERHCTFRQVVNNVSEVKTIAPDAVEAHLTPIEVRQLEGQDPTNVWQDEAVMEASRGLLLDGHHLPIKVILWRPSSKTGRWHVQLLVHHIAADGAGLSRALRELMQLYHQPDKLKGSGAEGHHDPDAYARFVTWQDRWVPSVQIEEGRFWKEFLAGAAPPLLPEDGLDPPLDRRYVGGTIRFPVKDWSAACRKFACSPQALLLSSVGALLHTYGQSDDAVVGVLAGGRMKEEHQDVVGHFVNLLPVPVHRSAGTPASEYVSHAQRQLALASAHQYFPYPSILEAIGWVSQETPLVRVCINHWTADAGGSELVFPRQQEGQFDLAFWLIEGVHGGLLMELKYDSDRFSAEAAHRIVEHFRAVEAALLAPPAPGPDLWQLPAAENELLQRGLTGPSVEVPSITAQIRHYLARAGDSIALATDSRQVTYRELALLVQALHAELVGSSSALGVYMRRSVEMVLSLLMALLSGRPYVPLDPLAPAARLSHVVVDSGLTVVLTVAELLPSLLESAILLKGIDVKVVSAAPPKGIDHATENITSWVEPDRSSIAYILYTSGTTGNPKGVCNTYAGLDNRVKWMQAEYGIDEKDRILQKTPFTFDVSVWEFFLPFSSGARLHVAEPDGHTDPDYIRECVHKGGVTFMHFVPAMLRIQLDTAGLPHGSLRHVVCSGEGLPVKVVADFHLQMRGEVGLHNLYGPTEACIDVTSWPCIPAGDTVPIGIPVWNTPLYVIGTTSATPTLVPLGVLGELCIGGVQVAKGYMNLPGETATRFVANPFEVRGQMYRTGDLVRVAVPPSGSVQQLILVHCGRIDRQVKWHGVRIELAEVEAACMNQTFSPISGAHVAVFDDQMVAFVTPGDVDEEGVLRGVQERLPKSMTPVVAVAMAKFPVSVHGKTDTDLLREAWAKRRDAIGSFPKSSASQEEPSKFETMPRPPEMVGILKMYQEVLGQEANCHTDFFAVGGNSLQAIRLASAIQKSFDLKGVYKQILRTPMALELAHFVNEQRRQAATKQAPEQLPALAVVPTDALIVGRHSEMDADALRRGEAFWLSDMQLEILEYYDGSKFHFQQVIRFEDPEADMDRLRAAITQEIKRQPAFSARFFQVRTGPEEKPQWAQVWGGVPSVLVQEAVELTKADQKSVFERILDEDRNEAFSVADSCEVPLCRIRVFRLSPTELALFISVHHIIYDGWSNSQFLAHVMSFYSADGATPLAVAPYNVAMRDLVQNERAASTSSAEHEFWANYLLRPGGRALKDPSRVYFQIPPRIAAPETITEAFPLAMDMVSAVKQRGLELRVQMKAVFLSAWLDALQEVKDMYRPSGVPDIEDEEHVALAVVESGRSADSDDFEAAVGLFWEMKPFVARVRPDKEVQVVEVDKYLRMIDEHMYLPLRDITRAVPHTGKSLFSGSFVFTQFEPLLPSDHRVRITESILHDDINAAELPVSCFVDIAPFGSADAAHHILCVRSDIVSREAARTLHEKFVQALSLTINA
ncbi:MAG: hypothetical protein CMJ88_05255 [Planctomycetes bacterium]|nr:hypothetical protein [Planctomycetota bacterium]